MKFREGSLEFCILIPLESPIVSISVSTKSKNLIFIGFIIKSEFKNVSIYKTANLIIFQETSDKKQMNLNNMLKIGKNVGEHITQW